MALTSAGQLPTEVLPSPPLGCHHPVGNACIVFLQAELQAKAAELESLLRAERNAQRDLKLVLAAAERQSQSDACDKSDLAAKCAHVLLHNTIMEWSAYPELLRTSLYRECDRPGFVYVCA